MLKKLSILGLALGLFMSFAGMASAKTHVSSYTKKNGTHVTSHYRSDRDTSFNNNWSTRGNVNPITGKSGYKTHR